MIKKLYQNPLLISLVILYISLRLKHSLYWANILSDTDFAKGVMEYNQEKNRYASVLLGLYAILNVTALAMIWKLK